MEAQMKRKSSCSIALFTVTALLALAPQFCLAGCGVPIACGDIGANIMGQIETETVTIEWSTDSEGLEIDFYRIVRYDCMFAELCIVEVATVNAVGTCGETELYSIEDSPFHRGLEDRRHSRLFTRRRSRPLPLTPRGVYRASGRASPCTAGLFSLRLDRRRRTAPD